MLPVMRNPFRLLAAAGLAALLAACQSAPAATPADPGAACVEAVDGVVEMSADNLEFSTDCIRVPADEPFTIEFTNLEDQPHNVQVFRDESKNEELVRGEIITGPNATDTIEVQALPAGEYYFDCLVHPEMNGSIIAE